MTDITYEHIKAIAKLENDVKERDATIKSQVDNYLKKMGIIKQLKADIDHNVKRALEIAEEKDITIKQLQEENARLKSSLKTILQAWQRGDNYELYEDLIEKHKLIEP